MPLLILTGDDDRLTPKEKAIELFKRCGSDEMKLHIFKNGLHNLHMGREKEALKACVLKWINAQLPSATPLGSFSADPFPYFKKRQTLKAIKVVIGLLLYVKGLQLWVYKS